jgi:FkbM family methyltransferase
MRKYLNRLLLGLGYRIEKVGRFERLLERLRRNRPSLRFVQVGANDGVRFDGLYDFVTRNHCRGVAIEPLPDAFEILRRNYLSHREVTPVNLAIHPDADIATFYRVALERQAEVPEWTYGIASFDRTHLLRAGVPEDCIAELSVRCAPLMQVVREHGLLGAELLQIDTEGFDAEVIRMVDFGTWRLLLVKYEHANLKPGEREACEARLRAEGYRLEAEGIDTIAWQRELD